MVNSNYGLSMEFGRGPTGRDGYPDLPPEHAVTTALLAADTRDETANELFPREPAEVRIGLSTWGDRAYRGSIYPPETAQGNFLAAYGRVFTTVELSATFYGLPDEERFRQWRDAVPPGFRFLPKVSQSITHRDALAEAQQGLRAFLERTAALGTRRGPVLLQLSPRFAPHAVSEDRLAAALAVLGRHAAVELRHPGWFVDGPDGEPPAARILRDHGSALVVTDTPGARDVVHGMLTTPLLVLRFVATGQPAIDRHRVGQWAQRITDWLARGLREVYAYVHLDDPLAALDLALRLRDGIAGNASVLGPDEAGITGLGMDASAEAAPGPPAEGDRPESGGQLSLF